MQPYSFSPIAAIYFSSETDVPDNQLFQVPILGLGNKKKKNLSQSFGFKLFAKRGAYKKKIIIIFWTQMKYWKSVSLHLFDILLQNF